MKYTYPPEQKNQHLSFLKRIGGIARPKFLGRGPKAPPQHSAKSTTEKRAGRNSAKCARYEAEGRRERHKATRVKKDKRRAKLMSCGHGKRHKSNIDDTCKKCYSKGVR